MSIPNVGGHISTTSQDTVTTDPAVQPFKDSQILQSIQSLGQTLMNWLRDTPGLRSTNVQLLYRASRDGWPASQFHYYCDNKGPTVIVAKSKSSIFGGYTEQNWDCSESYKRAPNSFLFSLVNPRKELPPKKMPLIRGQEVYAIYCDSSYGPVFGQKGFEGWYDLCFVDSPKSNHCNSILNQAYECPLGDIGTRGFFTGGDEFRLSEMEVFGFLRS